MRHLPCGAQRWARTRTPRRENRAGTRNRATSDRKSEIEAARQHRLRHRSEPPAAFVANEGRDLRPPKKRPGGWGLRFFRFRDRSCRRPPSHAPGGFTLTNRREQEAFTIASVELEAIRTNLTKRERGELLASFDQRWDHGGTTSSRPILYTEPSIRLCAEHGVKITYQKRSGTGPMEPVEWVELSIPGRGWPSEEPDYKKRIEMKAEFPPAHSSTAPDQARSAVDGTRSHRRDE